MTPGFSPLDERLGLLPGSSLTPWLVEGIVRLGTTMPFAHVPAVLAFFTGVALSEATVRRLTEAAGAAQVALEAAAVDELERTLPESSSGPPVQLLSVDGAMVPLVGGDWAEVKTLALGEVTTTPDGPRTTKLSSVSRLAEAETFGRVATSETHRRGTSTAGTVVAVTDGAAWCQGFIDLHRHDAVRILDFAHAVEHLGHVARAVFGPGTEAASSWLGVQAHALRHGGEVAVLAELASRATASEVGEEAHALLTSTHAYLTTRQAHIRYATFAAAGYPIGSGCVESANKLVVEARLKGAGMHWARANVNPMLAPRTLLANDRWDTAWPTLWNRFRSPPQPRRPPSDLPRVVPPTGPAQPTALPPPPPPRPKTIVNGKPIDAHPWKRAATLRAKR